MQAKHTARASSGGASAVAVTHVCPQREGDNFFGAGQSPSMDQLDRPRNWPPSRRMRQQLQEQGVSNLLSKLTVALGTVALACGVTGQALADDISGAGATFPYPIYAKWAEAYKQQTGIGLNYQSIGSGGGIAQIKAKTVDFGASDKPLTPGELEAAGLTQFPTVIGGVVPVVNLPGIKPGELQLDGATLAAMCLGTI